VNPLIDKTLQIWARRKWWLLAGFLLATTTSASLIFALPNLYRSSTTVLLGQDAITGAFIAEDRSNQLDQRLHVIRQEVLSREQLLLLIERFDLYEGLKQAVPIAEVLDRMRKDIHISQSTTSQVSQQRGQSAPMQVRIGYQGWSAQEVATVANALADVYRDKYEGIRIGQASRATDFLRERLNEVAQRMVAQELEISTFRNENLGQLPQQEGMNLATLERLNSDLRLNGERQIQLLNRPSQNSTGEFGAVLGTSGESRLELLKRELSVMSARYNSRHPGIIRLEDEITLLKQEAATSQEQGKVNSGVSVIEEYARLRQEETQLRSSITSLQKRLQLSPEIDQALTQMSNTYNAIREEHLILLRRYQDARLAQSLEAQQTQQFQVLELALPPDLAAAPNRLRLLATALILTVGGLLALVFVAEQLTRTFHSADDLREFSSIPVIASVGHIQTSREGIKRGAFNITVLLIYVLVLLALALFMYTNAQTAKGLVWLVAGAYV
jgi:succinoglycan biosynthesis transport protein ExoP